MTWLVTENLCFPCLFDVASRLSPLDLLEKLATTQSPAESEAQGDGEKACTACTTCTNTSSGQMLN